ncbi:hypothetical protein [Bacillus sp. JCM 19034]|uniref:hypothetical protein n=1 Tax=Bacillus sp. JCM 19034 TaxID=1481928 RepID=UPI000784F8F0|nr:hypothetical protein [Bacillus sp. JCM 19034]
MLIFVLLSFLISSPATEEPFMIYHDEELIYSIDHQSLQNPLLGDSVINDQQVDEMLRSIDVQVRKPAKNARIGKNGAMIAEEQGIV